MTSLYDEKRLVELSLTNVLIPGQKWEPISMEWFLKWKLYAEANNDDSESDLYPGPIDNSMLQGKYDDELKPGLVDNENIVILPCSITNKLFSKYSGGPRFLRDVSNFGSVYHTKYQVSLYRVRVEAYLCDQENPLPESSPSDHHIVRFFHKQTAYKDAVDGLVRSFALNPYSSGVRCWLREHEDDVCAENSEVSGPEPGSDDSFPTTTVEEFSCKGSPTAEITGDLKRARVGRVLTTDVTDKSGLWIYQRHSPDLTIEDVRGNDDCVHIIIEAAPTRKPDDSQWPRAHILSKWKAELRVGDVVDACDQQEKWFVGLVKEVLPSGDVKMHFKGWAAMFDETIPASKVATNIQPLYVHSQDRRDWTEGDFVDFRITPSSAPKAIWIKSKISSLDKAYDRVQVKYTRKEKVDALKKYYPLPPVAASQPMDDDEVKRQQQGTPTASPTAAASPSAPPSSSQANAEEEVFEWCDLLGEEICPLCTHTKKIVPKPSFPGKANFVGTGSSSGVAGSSFTSTLGNMIAKPFTAAANRFDYSEKHVKGTTEVAGAVGLQNLGNTCFMNSILQCVSNTDTFTQLFLSDEYKTQINSDNPLGHGGKLAKAYALLIKDMWCQAYSKVIPRDFKVTIGEFQPQFAGYEQQDSQEFLGFLLDGLHEDLNRVVKKPHVAKIESKGREDVLIASESWRRYLLRNDSALVDRCFGQLKSHVTCTNCGNESVTFDEYSSLSLPLPVRNTKPISVVVQLLPLGSLPVRLELDVEVTATMSQLQSILVAKLTELNLLASLGQSQSHASEVSMTATETAHSLANVSEMVETEMDVSSTAGTDASTSVSNNSPPVSPQALDNHYEIVPHVTMPAQGASAEDTADSDDFVTVYNEQDTDNDNEDKMETTTPLSSSPVPVTDTSNSSRNNSPSDGTPAAAGESGLFFQFGTLFSSRPASVFKSYNAAEHGGTSISSFVTRQDSLMAFQLEHRAPEHRAVVYSYSSYSKTTTKYDPADETCGYVAMDVCMGTKFANSERIELGGYPIRVALPVDCTNRFVHRKLLEVTRRYFRDDTDLPSLENMPYVLQVTNAYGSTVRRSVAVDDEVFQPPLGGTDILVVAWTSQFAEVMDEEQLTAVRHAMDEKSGSPKAKAGLSVYNCFDKFIEREQLAQAETLYCSKCQQHLAPVKKMDLWAAPDILIVQLKRFQYVPGQYFVHREKINDLVDFPIEGLDLTKYVIGPQDPDAPPVYDLYAVSHHSGGLGGGHYTATCKNHINNKWYDFNDSHVSSTTPERAVTGTAYVLFYKRRTGTLKWAGIQPSAVPMPDE